jgi:endonuclease/exonuclease/phosphatase family metal-dependent hydrolase
MAAVAERRKDPDQVRDVLGPGYALAHHREREPDGQGISIASRWPIQAVHEVALHLGPQPAGFACSALIAQIQAPEPVGRLVFVNHLPDWQLDHEAERERQTLAVAGLLEHLAGEGHLHMIVAGDLDAAPDAASIRLDRDAVYRGPQRELPGRVGSPTSR